MSSILLPISDESSQDISTYTPSGPPAWPLLRDDDSATRVAFNGTPTPLSFVACGIEALPAWVSISSVRVVARYFNSGGGVTVGDGRVFIKAAGTKYGSSPVPIAGSGEVMKDYPAHPGTLLPWTTSTLNAIDSIGFGFSDWLTASARPYYLYAEVFGLPIPPAIDPVRDTASRRVWLRRRADGKVTIKGNLRLLDFAPGHRLELAHIAGPHEFEHGWGPDIDQRRPLWVESVTWNAADMMVTLVCVDHRQKLCLFYDSGSATAAGALRDGLMRMTPGAVVTFVRSTPAQIVDATGQLVNVALNVEALAARGQVMQGSRANRLLNSAWSTGVDVSWTSSGEGSNGSNITEDTTAGLWPKDLSARCLKIQGGSPVHAADLQHVAAAAAGLTGKQSVSIYHLDSMGPLSVYVQRSIDSKYYRVSDQTWQVAKTWNALTSRADWAADYIRDMDVGGGATSITVGIGIPTATGVAGQVNRVAQAQLETGAYPGSPILTTTAAVTRAADAWSITNNEGARTLSARQFTFSVEGEPFWNAAELTASKTLWSCEHNTDNRITVSWNQATSRWTVVLRVAGVDYTASAAGSPVAGTRYVITVRLTGPNSELDQAPYTLSLLVDGVIGDVTATAPRSMEEVDSASIVLGVFDGYIRQRFSSPQVLTDTEISRGI